MMAKTKEFTLARGVHEDASVPAGYRQARAIASDGTEILVLRMHRRAGAWTAKGWDPAVKGLRALLDKIDPVGGAQ